MAVSINFNQIISRAQEEVLVVVNTLKEKGAGHFARPLLIAGVMLLASYKLVYLPPVAKLKHLEARLKAARATAQYADSYKDIRDRLARIYPRLPSVKDKDQWLMSSLLESLKAEGIVSDSLKPPRETESPSKMLIYQSMDIRSNLKYAQIMSWLTRVENIKPILYVTSLEITKIPDPIGINEFACTLGTIIPKSRPGS